MNKLKVHLYHLNFIKKDPNKNWIIVEKRALTGPFFMAGIAENQWGHVLE